VDQTAPVGAVGHRMARQRALTGLSQSQLATCSQVSVDVTTQVERGVVAASPAFTAAVARALEVEVDTLYGQPYGPAITDPTADHAVPALRAALDHADDPVLRQPPMTAAQLRGRLDSCGRDRAHSRYAQLTTALPELL
jgi:transcriptional regulator with XRE-family HTH domain